jgi:FAD/FMN-containing dehydrogenase
MDGTIVELVGKTHHSQTIPLLDDDNGTDCCYPHYALVETHGCETGHDKAKMEAFLEAVTDNVAVVANGVVAQDLQQSQQFWNIRESANPAAAASGYTYKYDVSLPGSRFDDFIEEMKERLAGLDVVNTNWGHILDGNLHFNVTTVGQFKMDNRVLTAVEPYLFEAIRRRRGSISAEHGLGMAKNQNLSMIHDEDTLITMRSLKTVFDPNDILNPGKVLPPPVTT